MRRLASILILGVSTFGLSACGDNRDSSILTEDVWQTITDPETGQEFRCLYLNDGYTSEFLCYDPNNQGVVAGG